MELWEARRLWGQRRLQGQRSLCTVYDQATLGADVFPNLRSFTCEMERRASACPVALWEWMSCDVICCLSMEKNRVRER